MRCTASRKRNRAALCAGMGELLGIATGRRPEGWRSCCFQYWVSLTHLPCRFCPAETGVSVHPHVRGADCVRLANRIYKCMISLCSTPTTYTSPPSRHSQTVVKKKSTTTISPQKSKQKTARNLGFQPFFDGASIHNGFAEKPVEHTDFHNILFFKGEMRYETDLPGDAPCAQVEPCCSICLRSSSAT